MGRLQCVIESLLVVVVMMIMIIIIIIITVRAVATLYCFRQSFFLCTHEPLHLARWNFALTCSLTTARTLLISKVIGQKSRSQDRIFGFFTIAK